MAPGPTRYPVPIRTPPCRRSAGGNYPYGRLVGSPPLFKHSAAQAFRPSSTPPLENFGVQMSHHPDIPVSEGSTTLPSVFAPSPCRHAILSSPLFHAVLHHHCLPRRRPLLLHHSLLPSSAIVLLPAVFPCCVVLHPHPRLSSTVGFPACRPLLYPTPFTSLLFKLEGLRPCHS